MSKLKTLKDLEEDPIAMQHCNRVISSYDLKELKGGKENDNK